MLIALWILWVLIWGAAGYFIVGGIMVRREKKRLAEAIAMRNDLMYQMRAIKDSKGNTMYTPFPMLYDLSKNEDLE